ncbi:MAG TPA: hypothetical protein VF503_23055 [Sphingobium sp.]|uniref:hypothetical protein n=1 Tax=Sphingobium sp. TaxID=1912891 RepID=UPI002ED43C38
MAFASLVGGCGLHGIGAEQRDAVGAQGETPAEIASSLQRMGSRLSSEKAVEFGHAVDTLTRVTPDKTDSRTVGDMSPQFVRMVQGRNADQIIQLADLYRAAAPPDRR